MGLKVVDGVSLVDYVDGVNRDCVVLVVGIIVIEQF